MPKPEKPLQNLVIIHYHLRPGGVRRVIESYLPALATAGGFQSITLATGELPPDKWPDTLVEHSVKAEFHLWCEPSFRYFSEQKTPPQKIRERIRRSLKKLIPCHQATSTLIWAHNLGLGRNAILADELAKISNETGVRILSHHHDFWFENRWKRWSEMRACGFRSLRHVSSVLFSAGAFAVHGTINTLDHTSFKKNFPSRSVWLPNPISHLSRTRLHYTRTWLDKQLGDNKPIWIVPTRLLRRKNLAEAILLTRWLHPEAWLVTTAAVSSPDEQPYAHELEKIAKRDGWKVKFGILTGHKESVPSTADLMSIAETVLLTSLQEGSGLPFLEAAALTKPLIGRRLHAINESLAHWGFRFPYLYKEVWITPDLFDWKEEQARQKTMFKIWKKNLPSPYRTSAGRPLMLDLSSREAVPFSRLTLKAQLEVLSVSPLKSWQTCADYNPILCTIKRQVKNLAKTSWPNHAETILSPQKCVERLMRRVRHIPTNRISHQSALRNQDAMARQRLNNKFLYPILMEV